MIKVFKQIWRVQIGTLRQGLWAFPCHWNYRSKKKTVFFSSVQCSVVQSSATQFSAGLGDQNRWRQSTRQLQGSSQIKIVRWSASVKLEMVNQSNITFCIVAHWVRDFSRADCLSLKTPSLSNPLLYIGITSKPILKKRNERCVLEYFRTPSSRPVL